MSTRAVLIALGLAALLSIITAVALRPKGVDSRPKPIISGDLAACRSFKAVHADGSRQEFELHPVSGEWIMRSFDTSGMQTFRWPANEGRIKGALRMLAEAQTMGVILGGDERKGTVVEFAIGTGQSFSLAMEPDGLGGRVAARVSQTGSPQRRVFIAADIAELFRPQGLAEWRDTGLVSTQLGDPSRIKISRGDRTLSLARVGKNWSIRKPLSVPADARAVLKVISAIAKLRVDRFEGSVDAAAAAVELVIVVETDLPAGKGGEESRRTARETLKFFCKNATDELWNAVVSSQFGDSPVSSFRGNASGPIQSATLRAMSVDPADYASRIAFTDFTQADVAAIALGKVGSSTPHVLVRKGTAWADAALGQDLAASDQARVVALLTLLCQTPANVAVLAEPAGSTPVSELTLRSSSGQILGVVKFLQPGPPPRAAAPPPGKPLLWLKNGPVWRGYEVADPGLFDWILASIR